MQDIINDNGFGDPLDGFEIDTKEPVYHLEDFGFDSFLVEQPSLDLSFGSRSAKVSVSHKSLLEL